MSKNDDPVPRSPSPDRGARVALQESGQLESQFQLFSTDFSSVSTTVELEWPNVEVTVAAAVQAETVDEACDEVIRKLNDLAIIEEANLHRLLGIGKSKKIPNPLQDTDVKREIGRSSLAIYMSMYGTWQCFLSELARIGAQTIVRSGGPPPPRVVDWLCERAKPSDSENSAVARMLRSTLESGWQQVFEFEFESAMASLVMAPSLCSREELAYLFLSGGAGIIPADFAACFHFPGLRGGQPDPKKFTAAQQRAGDLPFIKTLRIVNVNWPNLSDCLRYQYQLCLQWRHQIAHSEKPNVDERYFPEMVNWQHRVLNIIVGKIKAANVELINVATATTALP